MPLSPLLLTFLLPFRTLAPLSVALMPSSFISSLTDAPRASVALHLLHLPRTLPMIPTPLTFPLTTSSRSLNAPPRRRTSTRFHRLPLRFRPCRPFPRTPPTPVPAPAPTGSQVLFTNARISIHSKDGSRTLSSSTASRWKLLTSIPTPPSLRASCSATLRLPLPPSTYRPPGRTKIHSRTCTTTSLIPQPPAPQYPSSIRCPCPSRNPSRSLSSIPSFTSTTTINATHRTLPLHI